MRKFGLWGVVPVVAAVAVAAGCGDDRMKVSAETVQAGSRAADSDQAARAAGATQAAAGVRGTQSPRTAAGSGGAPAAGAGGRADREDPNDAGAMDDDAGAANDAAPTTPPPTSKPREKLPPHPNQTPPTMLNGIAVDEEGYLWVCDGTGSELLRLEAPGRVIVGRYGRDVGVDGPDDVVVDKDFVYYTAAFTLLGAVAKLDRKTGRATTIADVGVGVNPIAFTPEGKLYAGKTPAASMEIGELLGINGLYEIDPSQNTFREVMADDAAMNGFTVAPDGMVYGPIGKFTAVVKVDPFTKKITTLRDNLNCVSAVRYNPRDQHLYFLTCDAPTKPTISRMALDGSDFSEFARLSEQPMAQLTSTDNFAIAPDGTLYVTRFLQILVTRVSPDGKVSEDFAVGTQ